MTKVTTEQWEKANQWETEWWGNCTNTLGEDLKQVFAYAPRMRIKRKPLPGNPYNFDTKAQYIVDIGGGPSSLLLKTTGFLRGWVIDPLPMPKWVWDRYDEKMVRLVNIPAEDMYQLDRTFDEAWIYNCLQHTIDPEKIVYHARNMAKVIRVFEWIDTAVNIGHPHSFTENQLDKMFGGIGKTEDIKEWGCFGRCYYGVFEA